MDILKISPGTKGMLKPFLRPAPLDFEYLARFRVYTFFGPLSRILQFGNLIGKIGIIGICKILDIYVSLGADYNL